MYYRVQYLTETVVRKSAFWQFNFFVYKVNFKLVTSIRHLSLSRLKFKVENER